MEKLFSSSLKWKKNVLIINIPGAGAIFYHFVFAKTLNLSKDKWKLA